MVAFNFQKEFVPLIESGVKRQTIRQTKRCNKGDKMQLYYGQRTKQCRKIKEVTCYDVIQVRIDVSSIRIFRGKDGDVIMTGQQLNQIAIEDGFKNWKDMTAFFEKNYTLPFIGWVHGWE